MTRHATARRSTARAAAVIACLLVSTSSHTAVGADVSFSAGPPGGDVTALLSVGGILYAGTGASGATESGGRIFKSLDDGATWMEADAGLANVNIRALTSHGAVLYAATSDGVYTSTDAGVSWTRSIAGMSLTNIFDVAVTTNGDVYAGSHAAGVFKSVDGGTNWEAVNDGIDNLRTIAVVADGSDLYAGTDGLNAGEAVEVYKSTNAGTNWSSTNFLDIGNHVETMLVHDGVIYAGVHQGGVQRSEDNGASWDEVDDGIPRQYPSEPPTVVSLVASASTLYAGHFLGVSASTDGADSWSDVSSGSFAEETHAVAVSGTALVAGNTIGIWTSSNGGMDWTLSNTGLYASNVFALHEVEGGRLFAGTFADGIFLSDDSGRTWQTPTTPLEGYWIRGFGETSSYHFASVWAGGVLRSDNDGDTWTFVLPLGLGFRRIATVGDVVYVASSGGVYKSSNQGIDWDPMNNGLTSTNVTDILALGSDLYATTYAGVFRSSDGGALWSPRNTDLTHTEIHSITATPSGDLYLATFAGGVFKSEDEADSWTNVTANLPYTLAQTMYSVDSDVYVGLLLGRVFRTSNGGSSWSEVDLGRSYRGQAFLAAGVELFIGTDSAGVAYMSLPEPGSGLAALSALGTLAWLRRRDRAGTAH